MGETGTVKIEMNTTPKLEDCDVHCLFVGYSLTHPTGCYRMYDPKMHKVHVTHDVVWLHRMLCQKTNTVGKLNTDSISVGNWSKNSHGVVQLIEVGRESLKGLHKAQKKPPLFLKTL